MPVLTSAADVLTRKLPKLVSQDAHLALDYAIAGSLFAAGAWYWRRDRKAAFGSAICGASTLGLALLSSRPAGAKCAISFPVHRKLENGLSAMIATMPEFLHLENGRGRKPFLITAGVLTVLSNLTEFEPRRASRSRFSRAS
jgi:hypothetical protein